MFHFDIERFKTFMVYFVSALLSVVSPIMNAVYSLGMAFLLNIIMGILADVNVNGSSFSIDKAFGAIKQLVFFLFLIFLVQNVLAAFQDYSLAGFAVKYITYIVLYFYVTNILKNAAQLFPKSTAIKFLYSWLSTSVFSELKRIIRYESNDKKKV